MARGPRDRQQVVECRIEAVLVGRAGRRSHRSEPSRPGPLEGVARPDAARTRRSLGERGNHAAMPYDQLPAFMARLAAKIDSVASRALQFNRS